MRRRTFIAGSMTAFGGFLIRPSWAQVYPTALRRAAVVIGVDATGGLPPLNAAVTGAAAFAQFLRDDGFDVHEFLSSNGPVREGDLTEKLAELIAPGNLNQLLVYFAGHGLMRAGNEIWLLSGAPEDAGEAVTVFECQRAARGLGINNVVLIGDTCRSLPARTQFDNMPGSLIFPNLPPIDSDVTVDTFYATLPGEAALEVPVDHAVSAYEGIFTAALIDVFKNPPPELVVPANGVPVIPNRRLRAYMRAEVNRRAQEAGIRLAQHPQLDIMSDEPWNIGAVRTPVAVPPADPPPAQPAIESPPDALRFELQGRERVHGDSVNEQAVAAANSRVAASVERQSRDLDLANTGIAVYGPSIDSVAAPLNVGADIDSDHPVGTNSVAVNLGDRQGATVVLRFANGLGAPVAVLRDYGAHVTVGAAGIEDLRYTPIADGGAFAEFDAERERLTRLRALAREAAKGGVLGFTGSREEREEAATSFANQIRMLKSIDPTLGIYAVYAYDAANLPSQVRSVAEIMQADLGIEVYDPAMLAGNLWGGRDVTAAAGVVPFCPVLRQGWELLRVKGVALGEPLMAAQPFLTRSLFTTFTSEGVEILAESVRRGEID